MSDKLKRPYEVSVWEDVLVEEEDKSYYKEVKIATIGSDQMTAPSRISNVIFIQNVNGQITLTFDLVHKYYDDLINDYIVNPLEKYLVNERKVKLFYNKEWYDFVIKTCEETSDSNVFNYTATGLFANELGKVGYNIVLSNDLRNNQGTIFELGEKAVKGTDWVIDKEHSDIIQQFVAEPLYKYTINSDIVVKDLQTNEEVTVEADETLLMFYSIVSNKSKENIFFLRAKDYDPETTTVDDNNVAQMPNYCFLADAENVTYNETGTEITIDNVVLSRQTDEYNSTGINLNYRGYRLAYNQQIGYDTVKDRPVTIYEATYNDGSKKTIYKYTDYEYVTSDVVTNFVINGSGFNIYQDGSLDGWSSATPSEKSKITKLSSDLRVGENIGESLRFTNFKKILTDLRIKLSPEPVEEEAEEGTIITYQDTVFTYEINADYQIQLVYTWKANFEKTGSEHQPDLLDIYVKRGGTTIGEAHYNSDMLNASDYTFTFQNNDGGNLISILTDPFDLDLKQLLTEIYDEGLTFTTSLEKGAYLLQPIELVSYPNITASSVIDLTQLNGIKGYLRTQFKKTSGKATNYSDSIVNEGIGEYRSEIGSFSKGEEYVFRISYGLTNEDGGRPQIQPGQEGLIKAVIAKYTMEPKVVYDEKSKTEEQVYLYTPDINNILFEFDGPFEIKNTIITGGYFKKNDNDKYVAYYKDGVSVTPTIDCIYREELEDHSTIDRIWDTNTHTFVEQNSDFLDYYLTTAVCKKSISNTVLADTADDYGIFLYITDSNYTTEVNPNCYFCIKEVQLFKKKLDGDGNIVLIGNIPKATSISTDFFYLQPEEDTEEESIETFSSIDAIAESLGLDPDNDIKPLYNENYEKISTIEASQSNCFNIIQDLCESFECWAKFVVEHDETGAIKLDSEGAPSKKISFHKYSGDDNFAGFKYGINLESIQRTIESDEFVSKLIVEQVENDVVEGGVVSIASAKSNPSGDSYIINMSYYLNQGLIENPRQYYIDYNTFVEQLKGINTQYAYYNAQRQLAAIARTKANSNVNVYHELVEEAQKNYTDSLFEFKDLTGIEYNDYVNDRGYNVSFYFTVENNVTKFFSVFPNFVEIITPQFFDIDGNEIVLDEKDRVDGIDSITKEYEISSLDAGGYTLSDIKYIGIVDDTEGFEIPFSDGSYSTYAPFFTSTIPPAILSYFTKHIWEINHTENEEKIYDPPTEEDRLKRLVNIIPSNDHETLTDIVGRIYTNQQVINDYTPLLEMSKTEKKELDLLINGTKNYVLTVSTISKVVDGVEYNATKEILDDYIEGLSFTLENDFGTYDINTTVTEKSFSQDNLYERINFKHYPDNYQLKYTSNDQTYITAEPIIITIPIKGTKSFTLVPIEEQKGIKDIMQELLDEKDEVEAKFYKKYSRYIQEGTWTSDDYIDNELYYLDALSVSNTSAQPKVSYDLTVHEISEQPGFENYLFKVGDKTYIEDTQFFGYHNEIIEDIDVFSVENKTIYLPENTTDVLDIYRDFDHHMHFSYDFRNNIATILDDIDDDELYVKYSWKIQTPIREEVVVSEVEWHLDDASENTITIQNYKTQFDDLFQRMAAAVQSVEYNSASYSRAASILDEGGFINASLLLKSLNELGGGFMLSGDNTITAVEDGIIVKDILDPMRQMKIAGAGLKTSLDGGYNWDTVVTAEGLTINTIDTQNVLIKDGDNPSFRWDKYGLNAYGYGPNGIDLKTYVRFDKYGLYGVLDGEEFQAESLEDIKNTAQFGLLWDGFFIKNSYTDGYVSISSDNDFQVVANDQERIKIGALEQDTSGNYQYGIRIKNSKGESVFETDDSGDIEMSGIINAKGGIFTDSVNVGSGAESIVLQGTDTDATIGSSTYFDDSSRGWAIKSSGDAIFNNITARGAIKTAVFEYEEIEAVGGIFIFRPSSTIKEATISQTSQYTYQKLIPEGEPAPSTYEFGDDIDYFTKNGTEYRRVSEPNINDIMLYYIIDQETIIYANDLLVRVEKPLLFSIGDWCKVSNYTSEDPTSALAASGLVNVFEITSINDDVITLAGGAKMFQDIIDSSGDIKEIPAIIDIQNNEGTIQNADTSSLEPLTEKYIYEIEIVTTDEDEELEEEILEELNDEEDEPEGDDDLSTFVAFGVPTTIMSLDNNDNNISTITYLGNLSLWNHEEEFNTEENYLIIQFGNSSQTLIYVGEDHALYNENGLYAVTITETPNIQYEVDSLEGGALISFANYPCDKRAAARINKAKIGQSKIGVDAPWGPLTENYGIGINSSDSAVNLPARAISLFESQIEPEDESGIKVHYAIRGVFGTLPSADVLTQGKGYTNQKKAVNELVYENLKEQQGIYTDNIYLGDEEQYLAFYTAPTYKVVENPTGSPAENEYYEFVDGIYIKTEDFEVISEKTYYYIESIGKHFDIVGSSIDIALNDGNRIVNIINTTTDEGVVINSDKINTKDMIIGDPIKNHIHVTDEEIGFWYGDNKTAFLSNNKLYIPYSVVLNEMEVGEKETEDGPVPLWAWRRASNDNLRLVWLGGDE